MAVIARQRRSYRRGVDAFMYLVLCIALASCGTTEPQKATERTVEISAGATAVVPQSLGKIVVRYDPRMAYKGQVDSIDDHLLGMIQSQVSDSQLFGSDRSSPFTLTATVEWAGQTFSFSGNSGSIRQLTVRYSLREPDGQVVYRRKFATKIDRTDDQEVMGQNVKKFVADLSVKLAALKPRSIPVAVAPAARVAKLERPKRRKPAIATLPPVTLKSFAAGNVSFGNYFALIIGNNQYRHLKELKSASLDAKALDLILTEEYGFQTQILIDATRRDILSALSSLRKKLKKQDNLLIYYAGHGWIDDQADEGFWLPVDAVSDNPVNWISNASLISAIRAFDAKHVLVVADSCFSGKLTRGVKPQLRSEDYLQRMVSRSARTALTSGGLEPVLDGGGQGGHSVFAGAFFSALKDNKGVIDMAQLSARIRREVALAADQLPEYGDIRRAGHNGGDFLFVRRQAVGTDRAEK